MLQIRPDASLRIAKNRLQRYSAVLKNRALPEELVNCTVQQRRSPLR
jgi:hypothetical protein